MTVQGRRDVGAWLRAARERRGLTLERLATQTRIQKDMLRRIEEEKWEELPVETYTRGFLRSIARALDLDVEEVLAAHRRARATAPPEVLRPPPQANFKIRRAGMTVALLILIVLLTLLLSMVLRPRRRGPPILSASPPALEIARQA
jgi:cytoskeletal protein RodZ